MAQLAIKGHPTRGNEVIKILEMLGGNNKHHINNAECKFWYTILERDNVITCIYPNSDISQIYTLEEFLAKFPYKVGDKVQQATSCGSVYVIEQMKWEDNQVKYIICDLYWKNCKCTVISEDLQPYKEKTMEEIIKIDIPKGYEFVGVDDDNQQVVFEKISCQYPKTYEECCKILGYDDRDTYCIFHTGADERLFEELYRLKVCRDAYWKIAGDWVPDWKDFSTQKHSISVDKYKIITSCRTTGSRVLVFPTEEMRDAFYENFKELIEQCKELL